MALRAAVSVFVLAAGLVGVGAGASRDGVGLIGSARGLPEYGGRVEVGEMSRSVGRPYTTTLSVADFNGDGLPDVLATQGQAHSGTLYPVVVFINDGHGGFTDQTDALFSGRVPSVMGASRALVADFNGDGRADVYIGDIGADTLRGGYRDTLILSAPGGKLVDATANLPAQLDPDLPDATHGGAVADVNGDGAPDIFVGRIGGTRDNGILLNDGRGGFTRESNDIPAELLGGCSVILSAAFADVDGNVTQDLIVGGGTNPCQAVPTGVLLNDGQGRYPTLTRLPKPPYGFDTPTDIQAGDLNGDGAPDLVIGYSKQSFTGVWFQVLINDGDGHFTDETSQRLPPQVDNNESAWVWWIRLVDLNSDGHLDIATNLGVSDDHTSPYFLNDDTGHFTPLRDNLGYLPIETYSLVDLGGRRGLDILFGSKDPHVWLSRTKPLSASRRLYVTLGPGNYFSFVNESGRSVSAIRPGLRELVVWDRSPNRVFHLHGPGIDETAAAPTGIRYHSLSFKPNSKYTFTVTTPARHGTIRTTAH